MNVGPPLAVHRDKSPKFLKLGTKQCGLVTSLNPQSTRSMSKLSREGNSFYINTCVALKMWDDAGFRIMQTWSGSSKCKVRVRPTSAPVRLPYMYSKRPGSTSALLLGKSLCLRNREHGRMQSSEAVTVHVPAGKGNHLVHVIVIIISSKLARLSPQFIIYKTRNLPLFRTLLYLPKHVPVVARLPFFNFQRPAQSPTATV